MKIVLSAIILLLTSTFTFAQLENIPLITVSGESSINVKPDYVILGIQVSKTVETDSRGNVNGFEIFNNEDTRIRLFDFNGSQISETVIQSQHSIYIKEVFITIKDLTKLDRYLLELYKLGYTEYVHKDYRINNFEDYKDRTNKTAIKNARIKAELMAAELGQSIGKAHTIEEVDFKSYNWYTIDNKHNMEDITFNLGADNYIIEPGHITITSKVRVSFDLVK